MTTTVNSLAISVIKAGTVSKVQSDYRDEFDEAPESYLVKDVPGFVKFFAEHGKLIMPTETMYVNVTKDIGETLRWFNKTTILSCKTHADILTDETGKFTGDRITMDWAIVKYLPVKTEMEHDWQTLAAILYHITYGGIHDTYARWSKKKFPPRKRFKIGDDILEY